MHRIAKTIGYSLGAHGLLVGAVLAFLAFPKPFPASREIAVAVELVTPAEVPQPPKASEQASPSPADASASPTSAQPSPEPPSPKQPSAQTARGAAPPAESQNRFDIATSLHYFNLKVPNASFDAKASQQADFSSDQIAAFKARLKACWRLGPGVSAASRSHVVLRISLSPDGGVAGEPALIEASAAPDGPAIMQAAKGAVVECAPFAFLPRERYQEWKVLDVRFVPREMGS